jgi:DNA modification methylase
VTPFVSDPDFQLYLGDVREVLRELPDESVHCCVTSPPYWGLRDYGTDGQLGLEPTPDEYVSRMVDVFREVRRVLRSDGTCWLNIGDSYASAQKGGGGINSTTIGGGRGQGTNAGSLYGTRHLDHGVKEKDLVGIPWRLAFALHADGWYLRADIIWSKPNPMPESVTDRPTKAHEYLFLLAKSPRYFYDADAIREEASWDRWSSKQTTPKHTDNGNARYAAMGREWTEDELARYREGGRNKRSVWEIATAPYAEAHFATFPPALVEPCVKAGTSEWGCCPECGAPWERETESERRTERGEIITGAFSTDAGKSASAGPRPRKFVETLGWLPTCGCGDEQGVIGQVGTVAHQAVPCVVLDPFMGFGSTALVARKLGRKSIGVELNPEYAALAAKRLSQLSLLAMEGVA